MESENIKVLTDRWRESADLKLCGCARHWVLRLNASCADRWRTETAAFTVQTLCKAFNLELIIKTWLCELDREAQIKSIQNIRPEGASHDAALIQHLGLLVLTQTFKPRFSSLKNILQQCHTGFAFIWAIWHVFFELKPHLRAAGWFVGGEACSQPQLWHHKSSRLVHTCFLLHVTSCL